MSFTVGKARVLQVTGLADLNLTAPVVEWVRIQNNGDGTVTVLLDIFENQAAFDDPDVPAVQQISRQINTHPNVDAYLLSELALLPEFDTIT